MGALSIVHRANTLLHDCGRPRLVHVSVRCREVLLREAATWGPLSRRAVSASSWLGARSDHEIISGLFTLACSCRIILLLLCD